MSLRPVALLLLVPAAALAAAPGEVGTRRRGADLARGTIVLAGERVSVRWTDGDSFRIEGGRFAGSGARLAGVNALESYGPVHRIAGMDGRALLAIAKRTPALAAAGEWSCATDGRRDRYRRLLVACPDAALALVRAGHAMVFAVDAPADEALLEAQRAAQAARAGLWAAGVPPLVPTSLHAADEPDLGPRGAYDRLVDTRTGAAVVRPHRRNYAVCEEVCVGEGSERACMTHVPYERRWRNRPPCLR